MHTTNVLLVIMKNWESASFNNVDLKPCSIQISHFHDKVGNFNETNALAKYIFRLRHFPNNAKCIPNMCANVYADLSTL